MDSAQLNIFDQPTRINPEIVKTEIVDESCCGFEVGDRVQIQNAGVPLDKYNGDKGEITSIKLGLASVQLESIRHSIMFRCEALQKITAVSEHINAIDADDGADFVNPIIVGSLVECDSVFIGMNGTVRQIGMRLGITVAWVDFGSGKPLYPSSIENLILIENDQ
jgi:hypothetical protein